MESFNQGEHIIAAFLDVEKAFDNVWHNGLRYKIYQLDLPTKLCRWLSDIQVKIEGFLSPKVYPKAGVPQGSNQSPLLFLIYVKCTFQIFFGGCQGQRTGVGVTTASNSLILGGWVTKVLKNCDEK